MDWIEIIQLKSFTGPDRNEAVVAFHQLTSPAQEEGLREIILFRSLSLENELSILIGWQGSVPQGGKSGLGLQLAAAFAEFGHIYHSGWKYSANLITKPWRHTNESQIAV